MEENKKTTKEKIIILINAFEKQYGYAPEQYIIANKLKVSKQSISRHFKDMEAVLSEYREYKKYFTEII